MATKGDSMQHDPTTPEPMAYGSSAKKPIFFTILCVFVVIILQIVDLGRKTTCDVDGGGTTTATAAAMTSGTGPAPSAAQVQYVPVPVPVPAPAAQPQAVSATVGSAGLTKSGVMGRDPDTIVFGVDGEWPPYCWHKYDRDPATNTIGLMPFGFIYDFTKEACKRANLNCKFPLTGKWDHCWTRENKPGQGLLSGQYDMCICWVMTPGRMARVSFPLNQDMGWTKQSEGGFLTLKAYESDTSLYKDTGMTRWEYMKMDWSDGCDGATMVQMPDGTWADQCSDSTVTDNSSCNIKLCTQGKIRIGHVNGWALKPESFDWIENSWTKATGGGVMDKTRVIFIDEHTAGTGMKESNSDYNHIARALLNDDIDMAYTFANAIEAMAGSDCSICSDTRVWDDGSLTWHQTGLFYASGGVSGFTVHGREYIHDKLNPGVEAVVADKATYCPMCIKYWPTRQACKDHCIACDGSTGAVDYCGQLKLS